MCAGEFYSSADKRVLTMKLPRVFWLVSDVAYLIGLGYLMDNLRDVLVAKSQLLWWASLAGYLLIGYIGSLWEMRGSHISRKHTYLTVTLVLIFAVIFLHDPLIVRHLTNYGGLAASFFVLLLLVIWVAYFVHRIRSKQSHSAQASPG